MNTIKLALIQIPLTEGLEKKHYVKLLEQFGNIELLPIEIQGENAAAVGFIDATIFEYDFGFDLALIQPQVLAILEDSSKETESGRYPLVADDEVIGDFQLNYA